MKIVIRGRTSVCHTEVFLLQSTPVRLSSNSLKPRAPPTKVTLLSSVGRYSVAFTPKAERKLSLRSPQRNWRSGGRAIPSWTPYNNGNSPMARDAYPSRA